MRRRCACLTFCLLVLLTCGAAAAGQSEGRSRLLRLAGTPVQIGRQHGTQAGRAIRLMVSEYIDDALVDGRLAEREQKRVDVMKPSLPQWFLAEVEACAKAAGMDADVLLYAQCEGDIRSLPGCTTYVAFGEATPGKQVEFGRNFDYWGLESTGECVRVLAVRPEGEGHYAFVSVGWAGILGGWTFINEKGLFVGNNLGGGWEKNPKGIPTLILQRMIAQRAATVEEAIKLIKESPRMRGQAMVIGHAGDAGKGVAPSAALVLYDAAEVEVKRPERGFIYHTSVGTMEDVLRRNIRVRRREVYDPIKAAGNGITLHSVAIDPPAWKMWVAHGGERPHEGQYVEYDLRNLLAEKK